MKTQFNDLPNKYEIEHIDGNKCIVALYDLSTLKDIQTEDNTSKECEVYRMELIYNISYIEENYDTLLKLGKDIEYEKVAKEVKAKRDRLLAESDYLMCEDIKCDKDKVKAYRQALRDITKQSGYPFNVEFPKL